MRKTGKFIWLLALTGTVLFQGIVAADTPSQRNLAAAMPGTVFDFAGKSVPANVTASKGKLALSDRHYLLRHQSLRWDFQNGGQLTFSTPVPYFTEKDAWNWYKRPAICAFHAWIYNEKAIPGAKLRFEFGNRKRSKPDTFFEYGLNFTGWRTVQVAFGRDMEGTPAFDMDYFRIVAPSRVPAGTLYLDAIIPVVLLDNRDLDPDEQQPFVGKALKKGHAFDSPLAANRFPVTDLRPLTAKDRDGFRRLEQKLAKEIQCAPRSFDELAAQVRNFNLVRAADGTVTGKALTYVAQNEEVLAKAKQLEKYRNDLIGLRSYGQVMLQIAASVQRENDPAKKAKLEEMFLLMTEHLFDQGVVDGSIRGTSHHFGYVSREYFAAFLLMRDLLEKHGLLETAGNSALWFNGLRFLMDRQSLPQPDADIWNTLTMSSLIGLALLPDSELKAKLLRDFQFYYGRNIAMETPGNSGGIKADGCIFHHWGHYPGYGFPALVGASLACHLLDGTPWALPEAALDNLKRALKAAFIYTNPAHGAPAENPITSRGLCGRHPFGESSLQSCASAYRYLAADPEMAAIYRRLRPRDSAFSAVEPAPLPEGHWSFNYGCFGIHRFGGKMVTLKGYNRHVWSSEIYTKDNRYGRYQSNGAIEILPQGERREAGWDWNRNPGTTSLHRPLDVLESPLRHTLMLSSDSRHSGSSHLDNRWGVFAVELAEPERERFDSKFRAVKSVFAFGPRLVALGSGIQAGSEYPVETTLLQYPSTPGKYPVYFKSTELLAQTGISRESAAPAWVADDFGNAWFIFSGGPVRMTRQLQESRQNKTKAVTKGEFSTVWLDHGVRPQNARYEYLLHLAMTPKQAAAEWQKMRDPDQRPYRVLRQDAVCHAVSDRESGVTGAVFFAPGVLNRAEPVVTALTPGYVMFRREGKALMLSLNTPDLASSGKDELRRVVIRLRGDWKTRGTREQGVTIRRVGADTEIAATFRHGIPRQFHLYR